MEDIIRAAPPTTAFNKTALLDSYQEALQGAAVSYPNLQTAAHPLVVTPDEASLGADASIPAPVATEVEPHALLILVEVNNLLALATQQEAYVTSCVSITEKGA